MRQASLMWLPKGCQTWTHACRPAPVRQQFSSCPVVPQLWDAKFLGVWSIGALLLMWLLLLLLAAAALCLPLPTSVDDAVATALENGPEVLLFFVPTFS